MCVTVRSGPFRGVRKEEVAPRAAVWLAVRLRPVGWLRCVARRAGGRAVDCRVVRVVAVTVVGGATTTAQFSGLKFGGS